MAVGIVTTNPLQRVSGMSVWSRSVGKEEGLFTYREKYVVSRMSVKKEVDVM
jgi:hypothetical protein